MSEGRTEKAPRSVCVAGPSIAAGAPSAWPSPAGLRPRRARHRFAKRLCLPAELLTPGLGVETGTQLVFGCVPVSYRFVPCDPAVRPRGAGLTTGFTRIPGRCGVLDAAGWRGRLGGRVARVAELADAQA